MTKSWIALLVFLSFALSAQAAEPITPIQRIGAVLASVQLGENICDYDIPGPMLTVARNELAEMNEWEPSDLLASQIDMMSFAQDMASAAPDEFCEFARSSGLKIGAIN